MDHAGTPPVLFKLLQRPEEGTLSNSFCEDGTIMTQSQTRTRQEINTPMSLMNTDAKVHNKIPAKRNQQHSRKIMHHYTSVGFTPGMQGWLNKCKWININTAGQQKGKKPHTIISVDAEKHLTIFNTLLDKNTQLK